MTIDPLTAIGTWAWKQFGDDIVKQAKGLVKKDWEQFRWTDAATKYHDRLKEQYSTMRVLGKSEPVSLEGIFTDAYILDKPTALRRFDIEELRKAHQEAKSLSAESDTRHNALELAKEKDRLYILGKPGAGKTTFLKYLLLQALDNKIEKIPIFISLHAWAQSKLELMPFIVQEFDICAFPDAQMFIEYILKKGWVMVLFDAVDEVNVEGEQRTKIIQSVSNFVRKYRQNKYMITCRIAASEYSFEGFTDVEIADFNNEQAKTFVARWFTHSPIKGEKFLAEIENTEHRGLKELMQTPLLLALLCIGFEETMAFPSRRAEIYKDAIDALLKKWDTSRAIKRDDVYRGLSFGRKEQMFARIAAAYFDKGDIFFKQNDLAKHIGAFMETLPPVDKTGDADGEILLKAIEAQHGLFVERARQIYSFSHLTFQEYFTARYIVDNAASGALEHLIENHLTDTRWREVFLLTASMLDQEIADKFFSVFRRVIDNIIIGDEAQVKYCQWALEKSKDYHTDTGNLVLSRALCYTFNLDRGMIVSDDGDRLSATNLNFYWEFQLALEPTCQGSRHREQNLHFDNAHLGHDIVNILRRYESRLKGGCKGTTGSSIV